MPFVQINGARLYCEDEGKGPQTILFSHGLLFNCRMFDKQVDELSSNYRCVRYDHRGQGKSERGVDKLDMDSLAEDAAVLIEKLDIAPCHFVGLSMGGFVGMRLAARRPELLKSLTLLETSSEQEPNKFKYRLLVQIVRLFGVRSVVNRIMPILFGNKFLHDPDRAIELRHWTNFMMQHKKNIRHAVNGVIDRKAVTGELQHIKLPTLIAVGDLDVATVPAKSKNMHDKIAGSRLEIIPGAGHSSAIEEWEYVNSLIVDFLAQFRK